MLRNVFVLVISLLATIMTASAQTPPNNEIWYTTTDGEMLNEYITEFADYLVSHTYHNGKGILRFSRNVIRIGDPGPVGIDDDQEREAWWRGLDYHMAITFEGYETLKTVTIPNSVTWIYDGAFRGCRNLTKVNIPDDVTRIGNYAFAGCSSLSTITIPYSVTEFGDSIFSGCNNMKTFKGKYASNDGRCLVKNREIVAFAPAELTSYSIPEGVTSIGNGAFLNCSSLTSITIPEGVTSIGDNAFEYCSSLTSITIPEGVTSIESGAFYGCSSLSSTTIPEGVTSIGHSAFSGCSSLTSIIIPEGVTSIESGAFYGCSSLSSITIPEGVTSIGIGAFSGCSNLTSITIPKSVTSIGDSAFAYCSSLTSITIPEGVTSIGYSAFSGCSSLTSITIPESVTSIGWYAFSSCSSLTSITIPEGVTSIKYGAFSDCSSLTSITIPEGVTSIDNDAFNGCTNLKSLTTTNKFHDYFRCFESYDFEEITIEYADQGSSIIEYFPVEKITGLILAKNITSTDKYELSQMVNLKYLTIDTDHFQASWIDLSSIEDIVIGPNVTRIDKDALAGFIGKLTLDCRQITPQITYAFDFKEVIIGNNVRNIYGHSFASWQNLESIVIEDGATGISNYAFNDCPNLAKFSSKYASEDGRSLIIDGAIKSFAPAQLSHYDIPDGTTEISEGVFSNCANLTSITIPEGVVSIGNEAFFNCSSLTSITIPEGVTSIKIGAFSGCTSLTSINIPSSVTSIDTKAFMSCANLTSITIPNSVTFIGKSAFNNCSGLANVVVSNKYCYDYFKNIVYNIRFGGDNASSDGRCLIINSELIQLISHGLKEYVIPNSITKISSGALSGCNNLQSISIPNSVTSIGRRAFAECTALQHIDVGCNLKLIDNNTLGQISSITLLKGVSNVAHLKQFDNIRSYKGECASSDGRCLIDNGKLIHFINDNITRYAIPQGVTHVGENVFGYMHNLTLITIPDSVTSIGEGAFYGCSGLTSITIPENVTWIGDNALNCYNLESITCKAMTPPTISFPGIGDKVIIYVPKDAVKAYKKDKNWMQYSKRIKRIKE